MRGIFGALLLSALVVGCGTTRRAPTLQKAGAIGAAREAAGAGTRFARMDHHLVLGHDGKAFTQFEERWLLVVGEGADLAKVGVYRFEYDADGELALQARVHQPDGTVVPVTAANRFTDRFTAPDGSARVREKLAFPQVKVGSVLEFNGVVTLPYYATYHPQRVHQAHPIAHYRMRLTGTGRLIPGFSAFQFTPKLTKTTERNEWRLGFELRDLPARRSETLDPHWTANEPWWLFRIRRFNVIKSKRLPYHHRADSWQAATRQLAIRFFLRDKATLPDPGTLALDRKACQGKLCLLEAGLKAVRSAGPLRRKALPHYARSLAKAVASGELDAAERSALLYRLLRDAGVKANLAVLTRHHSRWHDATVPYSRALNHLVVEVPKQKGLDATVWMDPSCDWCAVGELPWWSVNAQGYRIHAKTLTGAEIAATTSAEFVAIKGQRAAPLKLHERFEGEITADGRFKGTLVQLRAGEWAANAARTWAARGPKGRRKLAEARLRDTVGDATLTGDPTQSCDDLSACTRRIPFEAPAVTVETGRALLPLRWLQTASDGWFKGKARTRPVAVADGRDRAQTLTVTLPEGWQLADPPASVDVKGPVAVTFQVSQAGRTLSAARTQRWAHGLHPVGDFAAVRDAVRASAKVRDGVLTLRTP